MKQINKQISVSELTEMSQKMYEGIVKAVVDIEKKVMMVDAAFHADEEKELIDSGSKQADLWGINLRPELFKTEDFVEFDSMINIRPNQNNPTRDIVDLETRKKIISIVDTMVTR